MRVHRDIAVVLLDVVMETDDAGLMPSTISAPSSRTRRSASSCAPGSPGRRRSGASSSNMTSTTTRPRPSSADKCSPAHRLVARHQQLQRMVETRRGLEMIIEGAATLYDLKSMQKLAEAC